MNHHSPFSFASVLAVGTVFGGSPHAEDGPPPYRRSTVGVVLDVTEMKQAGQSLAESESRYRVLADNATDMILLMEDGRIIERGTHGELMAAGGVYSEMVLRQMASHGHEDEPVLRAN